MNVFVYPPAYGFGMATLFNSAQAVIAAHDISWEPAPAVGAAPQETCELAHLYSLPDVFASFQNLLAARRAGKRVVATAVYWNPTRYNLEGKPLAELPNADPAAAAREAQLRARYLEVELALLRAVYTDCDVLVAESASEADQLVRDFGIERERIVVAWCGADPRFSYASPELFVEKFGLRDFVLAVGRVDANKNQLTLVRALRNDPIPVVFAGGSEAPLYLERCRAEAGPDFHFLPYLTEAELISAYAAARVHALVSWLEVVGLVTLEAAVAGCNVVLSREHGARDYVRDLGWYCDPGNPSWIRHAVLEAYYAPRQTALRTYLLNTFHWDKHGAALREAYQCALTLPPRQFDAAARANLEAALLALVQLAPLLEESRAALWQDKHTAEMNLQAYAGGRVMRALDAATRRLKH